MPVRSALGVPLLLALVSCSAELAAGGASPIDAAPRPDVRDAARDAPSPGLDAMADTSATPSDAARDGAVDLLDAGGDGASDDASLDGGADAGTTRPLDTLEDLFARRFTPITDVASLSAPASASYHCLAAASGYRRARDGAAFDPDFRERLRGATRAAADSLVASAAAWGGAGWGLDHAWDAFGDGSTNDASTVYAFQTGLAIWCLVEAADALGDASYRGLAERVSDGYRASAFVTYGSGYPIDCTTCGYFWYSLSPYDVGRMVKNTNIEMAVASLALDRYGRDSAARTAGAQATSSQYGEIVSYSNYGYLGRYDAGYGAGASSFDDHNSFEAYLLLRAGELLGRSDFVSAAVGHYDAYAPRGSPDYVAYAACHFARVHPAAMSVCTAYIEEHGADNPAGVGLVMDYR